ncbi:hypothetical protein [Silanimonas sp.]|jgi:hypothetical protein|uniref:hypothetical protein n=1 Tax=Silanimonas sp. TaxID=1929290 RepID=UPI0022CACEEE|nr:hypothetical protein [Silanimonas sp.]MCZ8113679.1 hypothetical protein [Silanimonas sp.]
MDAIAPIPRVDAFDISARGRIAPHSGWHTAEKRVNTLALRSSPDVVGIPTQPAWTPLVLALGGSLVLANRKAIELKPTIDAVNRIIDALNALPDDANFADLERALGLREPRDSHDRIGDAMNRVLRALESHRADANRPMLR